MPRVLHIRRAWLFVQQLVQAGQAQQATPPKVITLPAMVSSWSKPLARRNMGTQTVEKERSNEDVLLKSYNMGAFPETWWHESYDWSVPNNHYELLRRDKREKKRGGFALYVKNWIEYEEMSQKNNQEQVESSWAEIRDLYKFCSSMILIYMAFRCLYKVPVV